MAYTLEEAKARLHSKYNGVCPDCGSLLIGDIDFMVRPKKDVAGRENVDKVFKVSCTNPKCPKKFEDYLGVA